MEATTAQIPVYRGQFGEFTITQRDRWGTIAYRSGLSLAAVSFAIGTGLILGYGATPGILKILTLLFAFFSLGLGVSLLTVHIYLIPLHRLLQFFWLIGTASAVIFTWKSPYPLAMLAYEHPISILGIGFTFAALTGIFFKEAFCFNRLETKGLTFLVPALLLGHLTGILSLIAEKLMLAVWATLFAMFALRKCWQAIPDDIGDKSVFAYLKQQKSGRPEASMLD